MFQKGQQVFWTVNHTIEISRGESSVLQTKYYEIQEGINKLRILQYQTS
jgi:hypothetical protein